MKLFMLVSNHKPLMFDRFDMEKMIVSYCIYMIPNGTVANRLSNQMTGHFETARSHRSRRLQFGGLG